MPTLFAYAVEGLPRHQLALRRGHVAVRRSPWPSERWAAFFHDRRGEPCRIPWDLGAGLSDAELTTIAPSLVVFQQGESQEGAHFYRCAREHAERAGDPAYVEAHRSFMDEEKRHGADLARFLGTAGIPVSTTTSFLARAFAWLGSRGGLETSLRVVWLSEIIALVYYRALREATASPVLRALCSRMLRDEVHHVRFHAERLGRLRARHTAVGQATARAVDRLLFGAAMAVVWCGSHRAVLRASGLGALAFRRRALRRYRAAARLASQAALSREACHAR